MNEISRQTIIFFLPLQLEAIMGSGDPYTATGSGGDNEGKNGDALWSRRQLYINPQSINIRDNKLVKSDMTKGGFVIQYWGEALTTMEASGTTGSSGVEGIEVLRNIYRHEQHQYKKILKQRQERLAEEAKAAALEAPEAEGLVSGIIGGVVSTFQGLANAMDIIAAPFNGGSAASSHTQFKSAPSLAAFATNVDMYHQGEFFRGYFTTFSVTESATEPGLFTYSFGFTVTRRTGKRDNFMPWHREPLSYDGNTMMSQSTTTNKGQDGSSTLSFPIQNTRDAPHMFRNDSLNHPKGVASSKFKDDNEQGSGDKNSFPPNRKGSLSKKD